MNAAILEIAAILLTFEVEQKNTPSAGTIRQDETALEAAETNRDNPARFVVNDTMRRRAGQKREVRK